MFPKVPHAIGETILEIKNLRVAPLPKGVALKLRRGEILGLAGLVGSGRSETVRALFGLERAADGEITLRGAPLKAQGLSPSFALRAGFDLLSENRKDEGLALNRSIKFNLTLSTLQKFSRAAFVNGEKERRATLQWREKLAIKMGDPEKPVGSLSGGNQQKVALARMLEHGSEILFLDEPVRGIDVGSKAEICRLIGALAAQGKAIVLISSYLPELLGICDTLAVMHRGVLSAVRPVSEWTEEEIMRFAASGGTFE
jgi:ribose transport system ATP-binding protein